MSLWEPGKNIYKSIPVGLALLLGGRGHADLDVVRELEADDELQGVGALLEEPGHDGEVIDTNTGGVALFYCNETGTS